MLLVVILLTRSASAPADVLTGILKTHFDLPSGAFASRAHWLLTTGPAAGKPSQTRGHTRTCPVALSMQPDPLPCARHLNLNSLYLAEVAITLDYYFFPSANTEYFPKNIQVKLLSPVSIRDTQSLPAHTETKGRRMT